MKDNTILFPCNWKILKYLPSSEYGGGVVVACVCVCVCVCICVCVIHIVVVMYTPYVYFIIHNGTVRDLHAHSRQEGTKRGEDLCVYF